MLIQSTKGYGSDRLKVLIYADPGTGKTYLAKTIPLPTIILSTESGLRTVSDAQIDYIDATTNDAGKILDRVDRIDRLKEAYAYLSTPEAKAKYKCLFFDSISETNENLLEKFKRKYAGTKDNFGQWNDTRDELVALIRVFRDLPGYHIIMTATETVDKDENAKRFVGPSIKPASLAEDIPKYFDYMWRLTTHVGADKSVRRLLYTEPTDTIRAKSRTTPDTKLEPIEDVTDGLGAIFAKLKVTATVSPQTKESK